jgi:uncharacterized protein (TIGR02996 family)
MDSVDSLLEQLRDDRQRVEGYLVLADALSERGDPRAELVRVQCALERDPDDADARARQATLLEQPGAFAGFSPSKQVELSWRRGFVDSIVVRAQATEAERKSVLEAVTGHPGCALLHQLTLAFHPRHRSLHAPLAALTGTSPLRSLRLGRGFAQEPYRRVYDDFERVDADDDVSPAWRVFPALRELVIDPGYGEVVLGAPALPQLRSFEWVSPCLDDVAQITALQAPNLERLVVWTGQRKWVNWTYEADEPGFDDAPGRGLVTAAHLEPLLAYADGLPALTTFGLVNFAGSWGELAQHISSHPVSQRLEVLDLSRGRLREPEVDALLAALRGMPRLKRLVVDELCTGYRQVEQLRDALGVEIDGVETSEPSQFYYVSAQE